MVKYLRKFSKMETQNLWKVCGKHSLDNVGKPLMSEISWR
jgi:hypothetical protein